jgi:hypothetical protein
LIENESQKEIGIQMGLWHKALTTNVWLIKKSFNIES